MKDLYKGPLQPCNGSKQYANADNITSEFVYGGQFKEDECGCKPQCRTYVFETYSDSNKRIDLLTTVAVIMFY